MLKTLKWVYKLGIDKSHNNFINLLESTHEFHIKQAQIVSLKKYDENEKLFGEPSMSSREHEVAANTVYDLLTLIDPKRHPNLDRYFEKVL